MARISRNLSHQVFVETPNASVAIGGGYEIPQAFAPRQTEPHPNFVAGGAGYIRVGFTPYELNDTDLQRWDYFYKAQLADLVDKGVIIVESPNGTVLNAAAIRTL